MRLSTAGSVAACLSLAQAFRDTSPFFLASTEPLSASDVTLGSRQLAKGQKVLGDVKQLLAKCPTEEYTIIVQPGVHVTDYEDRRPFPGLQKKESRPASTYEVAEVVGALNVEELQAHIQSACGAKTSVLNLEYHDDVSSHDRTFPQIVRIDLPEITQTGAARTSAVQKRNNDINHHLSSRRGSGNTFIYITTPPSDQVEESILYEPTFNDPLHTEMKRSTNYVRQAASNSTTGPLFTRYQFLSPGIASGLVVGLILLAILGVGINAVASLQVSYAAFEKESGPTVQKK